MRRATRAIKVGSLAIGGGAPVSVQTMANADPHDAAALVAHSAMSAAVTSDGDRNRVTGLIMGCSLWLKGVWREEAQDAI